MAIWIDRKYILMLSSKLEKFKQVKTDLFNFRCPVCGDSQKNKSKARGYIFAKKDNYYFGCHNCGHHSTFKSFLHLVDSSLHSEYTIEVIKEKNSGKKHNTLTYKSKTPEFSLSVLNIPKLSSLPEDNLAVQYVIERKIPKKHWYNLYYADNFKQFVESISDKRLKDNILLDKPRLIIPFFNSQKKLVAFQGRALDSLSLRYITIKLNDDPKIFGVERIDKSKKIKVCEGPIDSLFLPNCIATADSNLAFAETVYKKNDLILIPDNQPRNPQIVKSIQGFIDKNFTVCLLPESFPGKDINEAILNGLTEQELLGIIDNNTFFGLRAKVQFLNWKKI